MVMGTVWRDGRGPAGLPNIGDVCGEPVHQGAAGTQPTEHLVADSVSNQASLSVGLNIKIAKPEDTPNKKKKQLKVQLTKVKQMK